MRTTTVDRRSGEFVITETRTQRPWRALPQGTSLNVQAKVQELEESKVWLVKYQEFVDRLMTGVRCWKCGTHIVTWQPVLVRPAGSPPEASPQQLVDRHGRPCVTMAFNHLYREGEYVYRLPGRDLMAKFTYLHCADCRIVEGDGFELYAILLAGLDHNREASDPGKRRISDDAWAQFMSRYAGVELVGLSGASKGPEQIIKENEALLKAEKERR